VDSEVGRPAEDTLAELGVRPPSDPLMALHASRRDDQELAAPARARWARRAALAAAGR
jgi:hypothetical protein